MESPQAIKIRIHSISSTRQITQSMRLVSTSKVQRARNKMVANRPFLRGAEQMMELAIEEMTGMRHPYITGRERSRAAVIVVAGDRGLCGGYNINVNKCASELIRSLGCETRIIAIGQKARDFCRRRYKESMEHSFTGISENPDYEDVSDIARIVRDWYDKREVDEVYLVYTKFESMLVNEPQAKRLLPLETIEVAEYGDPEERQPKALVRCEPCGESFLEQTVPFFLSACLMGAILESAACEQSERIASMDSAVKNADEMIEDLTLMYNRVRQDSITQEIVEIVGGAGAVGPETGGKKSKRR